MAAKIINPEVAFAFGEFLDIKTFSVEIHPVQIGNEPQSHGEIVIKLEYDGAITQISDEDKKNRNFIVTNVKDLPKKIFKEEKSELWFSIDPKESTEPDNARMTLNLQIKGGGTKKNSMN